MTTTTSVVSKSSFWDTYRRHGYFFREVAMLTILIGFGMHLYRVIFGDDLPLQYALTPTAGISLMIPITYAAVTGILRYRRMVFANRVHKIALTASLVYITASVPLHLCVAFMLQNVSFYVHMAGDWVRSVLICLVYPVFLMLFAKLQYRN